MNFIEPEVVPIVTTFANIKTINGDPINSEFQFFNFE